MATNQSNLILFFILNTYLRIQSYIESHIVKVVAKQVNMFIETGIRKECCRITQSTILVDWHTRVLPWAPLGLRNNKSEVKALRIQKSYIYSWETKKKYRLSQENPNLALTSHPLQKINAREKKVWVFFVWL